MAAYSAMITGASIAIAGFVGERVVEDWPINGQVMFFISMASSLIMYFVVSLCGKTNCNMDKLLHRGEYAVDGEVVIERKEVAGKKGFVRRAWEKLITSEFTVKDKMLYGVTLGWGVVWFGVFVVGCIANAIFDFSDQLWMGFWKSWFFILFGTSIVVVGWLIVGGVKNVFEMFAILESRKADAQDDGWVGDEQSCVDENSADGEKVDGVV